LRRVVYVLPFRDKNAPMKLSVYISTTVNQRLALWVEENKQTKRLTEYASQLF